MAHAWFIKINNAELGPLTTEKLKQLAQQGKVTRETFVKQGASGTWLRAGNVTGLFPMAASASTPATTAPLPKTDSPPAIPSAKSAIVLPRAVSQDASPPHKLPSVPEAKDNLVRNVAIAAGAIAVVIIALVAVPDLLRDKWELNNSDRVLAKLKEADAIQKSDPFAAYKIYDEVLKEAKQHKTTSILSDELVVAEKVRTALYAKVEDKIRAEEAEKKRLARLAAAEKQRLVEWLVIGIAIVTVIGAFVLRYVCEHYNRWVGGAGSPRSVPQPEFGKAMLMLFMVAVPTGLWLAIGGAAKIQEPTFFYLISIAISLVVATAVISVMLPTTMGRAFRVAGVTTLVMLVATLVMYGIYVSILLIIAGEVVEWLVIGIAIVTVIGAFVLRYVCEHYNKWVGGAGSPRSVPQPEFGKAMLMLFMVAVPTGLWLASGVAAKIQEPTFYLISIAISLVAGTAVISRMLPTTMGRAFLVAGVTTLATPLVMYGIYVSILLIIVVVVLVVIALSQSRGGLNLPHVEQHHLPRRKRGSKRDSGHDCHFRTSGFHCPLP